MRIGIDASNIRGGGGLVHLKELLSSLTNDLRLKDRLIIWGGNYTLSRLPDHENIEKIHIKALDRNLIIRTIWHSFFFTRKVKKKCDILFIPGGTYLGSFRPFVVMAQNLLPFDPETIRLYSWTFMHIRLLLLKQAQSLTFKRSDGIIYLTQDSKNRIETSMEFTHPNCIIITHGIRLELFPRSNLKSNICFNLLYISTFTAYKNQGNLIMAVQELFDEGLKIKLTLVGYCPSREQNRLIRLYRIKEGVVEFAGEVEYEMVTEYYSKADAYIDPSYCEAFGMTVLEAMAANLPVACSDRGPQMTFLKDSGIYFNPGSVESIKNAIRILINNSYALKQSEVLRKEAVCHGWEKTASATQEFIKDVRMKFESVQKKKSG